MRAATLTMLIAIAATAQEKPQSDEGKTKQFAPGCTGSIRTLDTSVREDTASYRTYGVRFELTHSCDKPFMPAFMIVHFVKRSDGVVISKSYEADETPVINPGDRSPAIVTGRIDVGEHEGKQLLGKPYVSELRAKFSGWRRRGNR